MSEAPGAALKPGSALPIALAPAFLGLPAALLFNRWVLAALSPDGRLSPLTELRVQACAAALLAIGLGAVLATVALRRRTGPWLVRHPGLVGLSFASLALVLAVILAEGLLTFVLKGEAFGVGMPDAVVFYRPTPAQSRLQVGTTLHGLTAPEAAAHLGPQEPPRVAFMGDSVVWGDGIEAEQTLPFRLGQRLQGHLEVINAGVAGYNFHHYAYALPEVLALKPQRILLGICLNDLPYTSPARILAPEASESGIMPITPFNRLLWGVQTHSALLKLNLLFAKRMKPRDAAQGAAWVVEDVRALKDRERLAPHLRHMHHYLAAMRDMAKAAGVPLELVVFPFRYQVSGELAGQDLEIQQAILREAARLGLPALDTYPPLMARAKATGEDPYTWFVDYDHLSARGAEVMADIVAEALFDVRTATAAAQR
ncbi:MAG: SGNH/GDSL hydrolase family protein [Myxococcales bacterium]|nr:SGNH/GDSL hydrolase family protein [Myxococcales bacterium]MCB9650171.1 SGNH/GDSL hydrolase family protein [Deltaproteobacteria bacterium]